MLEEIENHAGGIKRDIPNISLSDIKSNPSPNIPFNTAINIHDMKKHITTLY